MPVNEELSAIEAVVRECEEKITAGELSVKRLVGHVRSAGSTGAQIEAKGLQTINMLQDRLDKVKILRLKHLKQLYPKDPDVCGLAPRAARCYLALLNIWRSVGEELMPPDDVRKMQPVFQNLENSAIRCISVLIEKTHDGTATEWFEMNTTLLRGGNHGARYITYFAMYQDRVDIMELFTNHGLKVGKKDVIGETCMHLAAYFGSIRLAKWLKEKHGLNINEPRGDGDVPVCIAAGCGHIKMVEWFLDNGVDVNSRGQRGNTPMHQAALNGKIDVMRYLKQRGADVHLRSSGGFSTIESAISMNQTESIRCLVKELGMDADVVDANGQTAMFLAAIGKKDSGGAIDCIECLAELGADVNAKDNNGDTPVFMAAKAGKVDSIRCLTRLGADVNVRDNYGCTPVFLAAGAGHIDCIECLVGLGASVNAKDTAGGTPMFPAAFGGKTESLKCLAALGVDVNVKAENGMTALDLAENAGQTASVECLKALGAR
jgi:ankyrin repeat protein